MDVISKPSEERVKRLLEAVGLDGSDLMPGHAVHFFGIKSNDREELAGVVGLERYGPVALLRSLAMVEPMRCRGWGSSLVAHAEEYARRQAVGSVYLLTQTAESFFAKRGYRTASRGDAPAAIRATSQFSSLCPASAVFMVKTLI